MSLDTIWTVIKPVAVTFAEWRLCNSAARTDIAGVVSCCLIYNCQHLPFRKPTSLLIVVFSMCSFPDIHSELIVHVSKITIYSEGARASCKNILY